MKKIINGKRYDTDTAKKIAEWDNGHYGNDFNRCSETLYRKNTGEFFLYGRGGARSRYASYADGSVSGGEQIIVLTYAEAKEWAEEHLDGDEYENIFGEVVEDDTDTVFCVRLPASTVEKVRRAASEAGMAIGEYVDKKLNA